MENLLKRWSDGTLSKRDEYLFMLHKFLRKDAEINYPKQFKLAKTLINKHGFYFFVMVNLWYKPYCLSYFLTEEGKRILFKRFKYIALDINKKNMQEIEEEKIGEDREVEPRNKKPKFFNFKTY